MHLLFARIVAVASTALVIHPASASNNSGNQRQPAYLEHLFQVQLSQGFSSLPSAEIGRFGIPSLQPMVGAGLAFMTPDGLRFRIDANIASYSDTWMGATAKFSHRQLNLGLSKHLFVRPGFHLSPELGAMRDEIGVHLRDASINVDSDAITYNPYLAANVVMWVRRVFFEVRFQAHRLDLVMNEIGVNGIVVQNSGHFAVGLIQ